jgi:hypothetical protein
VSVRVLVRVRVRVYVCVCVFIHTPPGEVYATTRAHQKKPKRNPSTKKQKLLHVHLRLTIHAKVEKALEFRRHLTPNPKP